MFQGWERGALGLIFLIMTLALPAAASPLTKQQPLSFLHSTAANPSSTANTLNRKHLTDVLCGSLESSQQSPGNPKQPKTFFSSPPLDGPVGAPPLPVLTTKDPSIIERWLEDNVNSDGNDYTVLGFDQESIAKPPWMPERISLPDGPATIQLSTPTSCIIIQLSRCGDGSALYAPEILRRVINDPKIIKVGVGIDDDALELYRWSKKSFESAPGKSADERQQQSSQLWEMTSRFDIGCVLPNNKRSGIRELGEKILGAEIIKSKVCFPAIAFLRAEANMHNLSFSHALSKKLSMSNWGSRHLTLEQISYAARDAWVAAAVVERLQMANKDMFRAESLMKMEFMKSQRSMDDMDASAKARKAAKLNLKEILEGQVKNVEGNSEDEEERIRMLHNLLDFYKPDQPPALSIDILNSPSL